jgi:NAD(P)H-quinone oxidoreductase subunit 5
MILHDYHTLENAIGAHLSHGGSRWLRWLPPAASRRLYRFAFERGYLDAFLNEYVARPFMAVFQWCDRLERKWTDMLSRTESRESDRVPVIAPAEELT